MLRLERRAPFPEWPGGADHWTKLAGDDAVADLPQLRPARLDHEEPAAAAGVDRWVLDGRDHRRSDPDQTARPAQHVAPDQVEDQVHLREWRPVDLDEDLGAESAQQVVRPGAGYGNHPRPSCAGELHR